MKGKFWHLLSMF